jgi:hypothetical protein
MKIYTHLQIGDFHPTFCEDFLFQTRINHEYYLAAVMDGCSTAKDSHFASSVFAKILSKVIRLLPYQNYLKQSINLENIDIKNLIKYLLQQFFKELEELKNNLLLDTEELLSTLILLLYHQKNQEIYIVVLGDGVVVIDSEVFDIDQNNRPIYPAFFLGKPQNLSSLNATTFYRKNIQDVSIASDGVTSFLQTKNLKYQPKIDPINYLLMENSFLKQENMLHKKCLILEKEFGLKASDDLALIRLKCF